MKGIPSVATELEVTNGVIQLTCAPVHNQTILICNANTTWRQKEVRERQYMKAFAARKCASALGFAAKFPKAAHCASLCLPALPAAMERSVQAATLARSAPSANRYKGRLPLASTVLVT